MEVFGVGVIDDGPTALLTRLGNNEGGDEAKDGGGNYGISYDDKKINVYEDLIHSSTENK